MVEVKSITGFWEMRKKMGLAYEGKPDERSRAVNVAKFTFPSISELQKVITLTFGNNSYNFIVSLTLNDRHSGLAFSARNADSEDGDFCVGPN